MSQQIYVNQTMPRAGIAVKKNVLAVYQGNKVFLDNGQEFQLELFNPCQETIAARIRINDQQISSSLLVIKPGQRCWLERFVDENKKFVFIHYFADSSPEALKAIESNGLIKVEFFREKYIRDSFTFQDFTTSPWIYNNGVTSGNYNFTATYATNYCNVNNKVETGRIEKGRSSNQYFNNYFGDFESYPFCTVIFQILPTSQKLLFKQDIEKRKCHACGKKIKRGDIFCRSCGIKL